MPWSPSVGLGNYLNDRPRLQLVAYLSQLTSSTARGGAESFKRSYSKANAVSSIDISTCKIYTRIRRGKRFAGTLYVKRKSTQLTEMNEGDINENGFTRQTVETNRSYFVGFFSVSAEIRIGNFLQWDLLTPEMTMTNHFMIDISYQGA